MPKSLAAFGCIGVFAWLAFIVANVAAYITSIVFCFKHLSLPNEFIVLALSILPPVGVIHGWLLWFGAVSV